jgi:hypothetical protein
MNRFDLEAKLMQNHNIVDDLKTLAWYIIENQDEANADFFTNALNGLACLQEARNAETWDMFIKTFELDEYNNNNEDYNDEEKHEDRTSTK